MKIVNDGVHPAHYAALLKQQSEWYSGSGEEGVFASATTLIKPPCVVALERKHDDKIVCNASEMLRMLDGSAKHKILELAAAGHPDWIAERRYRGTVKFASGPVTISGGIDLLTPEGNGYHLSDFKNCSVWEKVFGSHKQDWERQVNIYAWLCEENEIPIESAEICADYRDWKQREARNDPNYPQTQQERIPISLWTHDQATLYIKDRIALLNAALILDPPPECSPEERWEKATKYAVTVPKRKSALRVCDSQREALEYIAANSVKQASIEVRPGERGRCLGYCNLSKNGLCPHYKLPGSEGEPCAAEQPTAQPVLF